MRRSHSTRMGGARERGAVLYIALIMLILLALIGIVGMQVTGMQERMAANYMRVNQAFQLAEASARSVEADIDSAVNSGVGTFEADQEVCEPIFDPLTWANDATNPGATHTRRIDKCFAASSRRIGEKQSEETGNIYEITALASDDDDNATASAVINTIFIP